VTERKNALNWNIILIISAIFAAVSVIVLLSGIISGKLTKLDSSEPPAPTEPAHYTIMESFENVIGNDLTIARDTAYDTRRVFWISEDADLAPKPNQNSYGEASDPSELQWLLDKAAELLDGQETAFSTDIEIYPDSTISYYLDDSIFVVSWQELINDYCYTFTEVKVSHPSQFRRHLSNNAFDSGAIHPVSRMAGQTNAVIASSADFYMARLFGIVVYQGEVKRFHEYELADTCFIDRNGNMILVPAGVLTTQEEAQAFVDEHNIDFSLAFGPILVNDGVRCDPDTYYLGEIIDNYPRVALCQKDELHYIVVTANAKLAHRSSINIRTFTDEIEKLHCQKAYTLDGGRTGTVVMNGKVVNPIVKSERWISDTIYFATAIPSAEDVPVPTEP